MTLESLEIFIGDFKSDTAATKTIVNTFFSCEGQWSLEFSHPLIFGPQLKNYQEEIYV